MAIQPQIAMGFRPPQFESPLNMMSQFAQLQSAQQANALRQSQMQKMQLDEERRNALTMRAQSGAPLTFEDVVPFGEQGFKALEAQQGQLKAQQEAQAREQEQMRKRQGMLAQTLFNVRDDPSNENFQRMIKTLRQTGMDKGLEADIVELLTMDPDQRKIAVDRYIQTTPGMAEYITGRRKETAGVDKTQAEIAKTQVLTDVERARLAGTLPRGEQQRLAPSIQTIADPTDPSQQLLVDATTYRGGGLGSPGVLGRPGITREPAPVLTTIQDPNDPTRTIVVNARSFQGQRDGAGTPGVVGVAGAQATVSREDIKKELAQTQLNDTLDAISGMYAELNRLGGIASTERSAFANVPARIAGSAVGQIAGQAIGTSEQSLRDRIAAARFTLVQQIKNATGMSARQMDSNVELQNTLNSLSDPRQGYEAAINIIENLRKTYGLGGGAPTGEPASRGAAGGPAAAPAQPASGAPIRLPKDNADAVYNSLPSGAQFIDPNGVLRRKP
jgi:hypothetical protein